MSVQNNKTDFFLLSKILVQKVQGKKTVVIVCVALFEKNSLLPLEKCKSCKFFPAYFLLLGPGGIVIGKGGGSEEETSPSHP